MVHKMVNLDEMDSQQALLAPAYGARAMSQPVPKYEIPKRA